MSDVDSFMNPYTQQVIDPVLRDIEQYYSTQIDEMPMNVAELV